MAPQARPSIGTAPHRGTLVTPAERARRRRRLLIALYATISATWFLRWGIPTERFITLAWLFGAMAVALTGDRDRGVGLLARDWGAFGVLLLAYRYTAGLAESLGRPVLVDPLVSIDRAIGLGLTPTERLQGWFPQTGTAPWWQVPLSFVYVSHFFAVLVVAAVLWLKDRPTWLQYVRRLLALGVLATVTYALVPAAPPWMAADEGLIAPIERSPFLGWARIGLGFADPLIESGRALANPVAALPSMHAGFAAFILVFLWPRVGAWPRAGLVTYAGAMAFTLVLTGEHWVADVILGWAYVALVMVGVAWWERTRLPPQ